MVRAHVLCCYSTSTCGSTLPCPLLGPSSGSLVICHPRQARPGAASSNLKIATVMLGRLQLLHPTPLSTFSQRGHSDD